MRIPLSWLREWIDLPEREEELRERLTFGGLEVEEIQRTGPDLSALRVGHVLECGRHPNADRLSVCRVEIGEGDPIEVVCGAPNVGAGQKVAVATPGTVLPDGTKLKKTRIRGVTSQGMICSERELCIGDDQEGILVLDPEAPVGAPLSSVVPSGEVIAEIAIPPNRGDCASILGVAREVRAHFGGSVRLPPVDPPEGKRAIAEDARIEIEDPEGCYRYVARIVKGVRVGPSPVDLSQRLEAAGLRSINVVVDVTNLVLLEFGQPIHAFDLSTLRGGLVRVRAAGAGERLRTLDGQVLALTGEDLVIADAERAIALAGVMGGAETEVRESTTDVLIESAHFHPSRVRRTARRVGLQTEASYRFERGVDPAGIARAADRVARLLAELAGGEVSRERIEIRGSTPPSTEQIRLEFGRVNRLLGTALSREEIVELLGRIGVSCEPEGEEALQCHIPTHRNDLHRPIDLVEEVARTFGCDRIPLTMPVAELRGVELPLSHRLTERARDRLCAAGLHEVESLPLIRARDLDGMRLAPDDSRRRMVEVLNPMVEDQRWLRPLLLPSLLEFAQRNRSRQVDEIRLFEAAHVFLRSEGDRLPEEPTHVAAVLCRGERPSLWEARDRPALFFEAKGIVEALVRDLGWLPTFPGEGTEPFLHPGAATGVASGGRPIGFVGELHPSVADKFDLQGPCAALELDLTALALVPGPPRVYKEVSRHPLVRRDLAVLVDRDRASGELLEAIGKAGGSILAEVDIFDRYEGKGVPEGKVSLAFRLVFQRPDRTLTDAEVGKQSERIVQALAHRFGATLR